jgi:lysophospholipase L1-like esterase
MVLALVVLALAQGATPLKGNFVQRGCRDRSCWARVSGRGLPNSGDSSLCANLLPVAGRSGSWWCVNGDGAMASGSAYAMTLQNSPSTVTFDSSTQQRLNPTNVSQEQYLASATRSAPSGNVTVCALGTKGALMTVDWLSFSDHAGTFSWLAEDNGTSITMYGLSSTKVAPAPSQWSESLVCLRYQASNKDASICVWDSDVTNSGCNHQTVTDSSIPAGSLKWIVGGASNGTAYNMRGFLRGAFLTEAVLDDTTLQAIANSVVTPSPPPGWQQWTNGANLNALGSHGVVADQPVTSWSSLTRETISTPADFAAVAPSVADAGTPHYVYGDKSVAFSGVYNQLVSVGSGGAPLRFIHQTGIFDAFVQLRRRNTTNGTERRVFGGSEGQAGLFLGLNTYSNTEGTFWIVLGNGSTLMSNYRTTIAAPLGQVYTVLVRGDGTNLKVATAPFTSFETAVFANAPGGADAGYDYAIGAISTADTVGVQFFEGDVLQTLVYPTNNSGAYLTQANTYFAYRSTGSQTQLIWAALGDSLTEGATGIYPWPARVTANLRSTSYAVANQGKSGGTASDANTRWTNQVKGQGFHGLVLFIGINDILAGTSAATIFTSISATVTDALAQGIPVVVMTLSPFGTYVSWTSGKQTQWAALNTSIRALAGVTVLDAASFMADPNNAANLNPAYDFGDGLHFNDTGFVAMAAQVQAVIQR